MTVRHNLSPILVGLVLIFSLAACDLFGGESSDRSPSFEERNLIATSNANQTLTAAPRETWTRQSHQTLTALPANETATGVAMGATETSAAVATQQLFTREAQTVAANLTGTRRAQQQGTAAPTPTQTPTVTNTPTITSTPTLTSTPAPALTLHDGTILNIIADQTPLDQIFPGHSTQHVAVNVTDPARVYTPTWVTFLNQNQANTLINTWATGDTALTLAGNRFPSQDQSQQWQDLQAQGAASSVNDVAYSVSSLADIARFREVRCKTGARILNERPFTTGYCDMYADNVHFGFNFLTTGDAVPLMDANVPLMLTYIAGQLGLP